MAAVAVFIGGMFTDYSTTKILNSKTATKIESQPACQSLLNSPLVSSIFAAGKLDSVNNLTINVSQGSSTLRITTNSSTKFVAYSQLINGSGIAAATPRNIALDDLKPGDYLNINLKVSPSGQLVATSISRLSSLNGN